MMIASQFIEAARALKGAKWRHRGRRAHAVDCIGLVVLAARSCDMFVEDVESYGREPWDDLLRKGCSRHWGAPLKASEAQPGDVAVLRWGPAEPSHMGVIGDHPDGGLTIIHAQQIHGVVEQSLRENLLHAVVEVYRPRWSKA